MSDKTELRKRIEQLIDERNEELLQEVEIKKVINLYSPAFDNSKSFWKRLLAFLKAENELGRDIGNLLDEYASDEINDVREFVKKCILSRL